MITTVSIIGSLIVVGGIAVLVLFFNKLIPQNVQNAAINGNTQETCTADNTDLNLSDIYEVASPIVAGENSPMARPDTHFL
jgi:hypothetical protein